MVVRRFFVPWYRRGLATAVTGQPTAGRAGLPVTIALDGGGSQPLPVQLAGPADVVGLDPLEISRCEPYDGCPEVEPGYFPYMELASADLPWRFSPYGPESLTVADPEHAGTTYPGSRLLPWLALVVVPADRATVLPAEPGGLPVLQTTGDQLPPPGESWAWAHVQVTLTDPPADPTAALTAALTDPSRSVARLLCPRRLDPATRYGAYLVPTFAAGPSVLAASAGPAGAGAVGADPLAPAWAASGEVSLPIYYQWSFSTSAAGTFELLARRLRPRHAPGATAGRLVDTSAPGWAAGTQPGRTTVMQGALRPVDADESAADPTLAAALRTAVSSDGGAIELLPPIYGQDYQGGLQSLVGQPDGWLVQLNTDPRRRLAAGLAAWAVAVQQDELSDDAWQQLAAAGVATTADRASRDLAALVTATLTAHQSVTAAASVAATGAPTVRAAVATGTVGFAASPAALRIARRFATTTATRQDPGEVARLVVDEPVGPRRLVDPLMPIGPVRPGTVLPPTPLEPLSPVRPVGPLTPVGQVRPVGPLTPVGPIGPIGPVRPPRPPAAPPTTFAPTFAAPAYELLRAVAPEWLLPGAESVPLDSVVLLRTNPGFVESYLVGLNHAMAQELVWRGYPLNRSGTMFARFWDQPDTAPAAIAGWPAGSALGSHLTGADELVLLLRGSFVARFPTAVILLSRDLPGGAEQILRPNLYGRIGADAAFVGFPLTPAQATAPITDGGGPWRVVLQEDVAHARFGVDDPTTGGSVLTSWQDLDWGQPQLADALTGPHLSVAALQGVTRPVSQGSADSATWGASSGHLASALQQPAFRLRIPLGLWLTPGEA